MERIGKDFDGGYLVCSDDILNTDILLSFGIGDDWSFEKSFYQKKKIEIRAFDGSISSGKFLLRAIKRIIQLKIDKKLINMCFSYWDFKSFFRGDRCFQDLYVSNFSRPNKTVNLESIFSDLFNKSIFVKMDIEGDEYSLLNILTKYQIYMSGLVIEFHDVHKNLYSINKFIKEMNLNLIHIHPNNFGGVDRESGVPAVVEFTFSRWASEFTDPTFPHKLDLPNNSAAEDIVFK